MFQPVLNVAELRLTYQQALNDSPIQTVLHFKDDDGWNAATLLLLAQSAVGDWASDLRPIVPGDVNLVTVDARDLSTEFGAVAFATGLPLFGQSVSQFAPPSVNALIRFTVGAPPPRRGRCFWPWVAELDVSPSGRLLTTFREDLRVRFEAFIASCEASTANRHTIVSRYSVAFRDPVTNPKGLRPAGVAGDVTSYSVAEVIASQRDRRPALS